MQLERFRAVAAAIPAKRYSLANSAGICLGRDYSFDLVRPGLSLYGGVPRQEAAGRTRRSEEHTSELQSRQYLVCRLLLEKKKSGGTVFLYNARRLRLHRMLSLNLT